MSSTVETIAFGGKHTPEQTLIDALSHVDGMQCVVVVHIDKDDYVVTTWSDGGMCQRIGMLDVGKARMLAVAMEADDDE